MGKYEGIAPNQLSPYTLPLAGPLPTIIAPHGGPHTAVTAGWFMPYAYLATLGYAVICPNYR